MPSTRPRPSGTPKPSKESVRTAIIASVVIGTFAIFVLVCMLWSRRIRRSAKAGTRTSEGQIQQQQRQHTQAKDEDLETGVIHEPLPTYQKEPKVDKTRVEMTAVDEGVGGGRGGV